MHPFLKYYESDSAVNLFVVPNVNVTMQLAGGHSAKRKVMAADAAAITSNVNLLSEGLFVVLQKNGQPPDTWRTGGGRAADARQRF